MCVFEAESIFVIVISEIVTESVKSGYTLTFCVNFHFANKIKISLETNGSALNSDKLARYIIVDRENVDLNRDASFVKVG